MCVRACARAVERCFKAFGRFCYVPIGKAAPEAAQGTEGLNERTGAGTLSPVTPLEVRFLASNGGGDFCLAYGAASALHAFGDAKLPPLIAAAATDLEQKERQMEALRALAVAHKWNAEAIVGEDAAHFDPLACAHESVYMLHLKEIDGATDHAVGVSVGHIFDANRSRALPLSPEGLAAIGYAGVVSVTRLTPSGRIANAIAKKRAAA